MSNEKFTQGEWKAVVEYRVIDAALVYFSDKGGIDISAAPDAIANAHLISAAPDMYRALQKVIEDSHMLGYIQTETLAACDAALAKADGGNNNENLQRTTTAD